VQTLFEKQWVVFSIEHDTSLSLRNYRDAIIIQNKLRLVNKDIADIVGGARIEVE